jgi:hypothetical protein
VTRQFPTIEGFSPTARTVDDLPFAFEVILPGGTLPNVCDMKHVGQSDEVQLKTLNRMDSILVAQFVNLTPSLQWGPMIGEHSFRQPQSLKTYHGR